MKNKFKKYKPYLIILIVAIIVSIPLLFKNLNIYQDDGVQHVCRLIRTWQTLSQKQFLPMIMSGELNNFGYSWNLFYSPLTAFLPLLLKIFNLNFETILKVFLFLVTYLSGFTMYKCVLKLLQKQKIDNEETKSNIAILAAIFYIFAPYRLTDMYIRMAVAELTSFIFLPMIFEGLYIILNENKRSYLLAVGASLLVITHTVITMYVAILCLAYVVIEIALKVKNKENIKQPIMQIIKNLVFILVLTSFYWVGLLQSYFSAEYEVFVPGRMQRLDVLKSLKPKFYELFITLDTSARIYEIGLVTLVGLVLTPLAYKKIDKSIKPLYLFFILSGVIITIVSLNIFPYEKLPSILTMIQFTFRLYEFTSFFFAIIAAINFGVIIKNFKQSDVTMLFIITLCITALYVNKLNFSTNYKEEELLEPVEFSSQTGRVHSGMASMEYMPSKMFKNKDYVINRKDEPVILNSKKTTIKNYRKNGSNMELTLENAEEGTKVELPYTYYIGYRIYENENEIKYTESEYGFIQIELKEKSQSTITVKYLGTNLMLTSYVVSILGVITLIVIKIKQKTLVI